MHHKTSLASVEFSNKPKTIESQNTCLLLILVGAYLSIKHGKEAQKQQKEEESRPEAVNKNSRWYKVRIVSSSQI